MRLVYLQYFDRAEYAEKAKNSYSRKIDIPARRGYILDRREEIVARNRHLTKVIVDKYHLRDARVVAEGVAYKELSKTLNWEEMAEEEKAKNIRLFRRLLLEEKSDEELIAEHRNYAIETMARPLGMTVEELSKKINGTKQMDVTLTKDLRGDVADQLEELVNKSRIQGFRFERIRHRWYATPDLATHVVGFVGYEGDGKFGLEKTMNSYLAGRDGFREIKRDVRGLLMPSSAGKFKPPVNGLNIHLSLDMGMQSIIEEELDAALEEYKSERGTIILMEPKTGDVLALASRPHFNLNTREGVDKSGNNFAIQSVYEPGSTFKIVSAAGALNEKVAWPQSEIFCHNGVYREGKLRVPDHHPYGNLTLEKILAKSSNIGAYKLALRLGHDRFHDYVHAFGFGKKTGISLSGENKGFLNVTGNQVDFSRRSYGYAVSVTPLQIASAYCVLANGGKLMKPRVVNAVTANNGAVIERFDPIVERQVVSEKTAKMMRSALATVAKKGGTATRAAVPGFEVAGKTGTAKKHDPKRGGYLDGRYTVSFAGMLPAENPDFVCVVVIDDPLTNKVKRYGGTIAAPVFSKVAARAANYLNLEPSESPDPLAANNR